jgi:hypothetical protein
MLVVLLPIGLTRCYHGREEAGEFVSLMGFEISVSINGIEQSC